MARSKHSFTDADGRVKEVKGQFEDAAGGLLGRMMGQKKPWIKAIAEAGFDKVDEKRLEPLFKYLEVGLGRIVANNELSALTKALDGRFIKPGPGGDPIRNPDVLPTGANMHALDPQSIPTTAAVECAESTCNQLLDRLKTDNGGEYPESIAFTLWGTDNIKT